MGKHSKHKRRKHTRSESEPPPEGPKWLRYAALGKKRKLRAALAAQPGLVGYADPDTGDTALHQVGGVDVFAPQRTVVCILAPAAVTCHGVDLQACRHGHADVVGLLLRYGWIVQLAVACTAALVHILRIAQPWRRYCRTPTPWVDCSKFVTDQSSICFSRDLHLAGRKTAVKKGYCVWQCWWGVY